MNWNATPVVILKPISWRLSFAAGVMCALSAMVSLEIPHVNVMSKLDLLSKKAKKELERCEY